MILHLTRKEKFTKPFIEFIRKYFDIKEHFFLLIGGQQNKEFEIQEDKHIKVIKNKNDFIKYFINFNIKMYRADKIIIHGLSQPYSVAYLFFNPWLLRKCYWIIWGADLYGYLTEKNTRKEKLIEQMKQNIIPKIGNFVTNTRGDYELAKKWYGAKGRYIKCFNYPSNLYKEYNINEKQHSSINIQIGNSAAPSNNHLDIFRKLSKFKNKDINLFVPLSYGDKEYANDIILKGKEIFGDKFKPMTKFMPFHEYLEFLTNIDIAIFNHKRQQAFGNIITLLGLGKKVYIHKNSTLNDVFNEDKIIVYNTNNINIDLLDTIIQKNNITKVKANFSEQTLIKSLKSWIN